MMSRFLVVALALLLAAAAHAAPKAAEIAHGREVFQAHCAACHGAGIARPGTEALQRKYHGTVPALLAERKDLTPRFVKAVVRNGTSWMPGFRKTEISDQDLGALAAYLCRHTP